MGLGRNTHYVFRLMYHFLWISKYRHKKFVEPDRFNLKRIIGKIGYGYIIEIVELKILIDHIHMVVRTEPEIAPAYVMQAIKSTLVKEFFKLHSAIKKKNFRVGS